MQLPPCFPLPPRTTLIKKKVTRKAWQCTQAALHWNPPAVVKLPQFAPCSQICINPCLPVPLCNTVSGVSAHHQSMPHTVCWCPAEPMSPLGTHGQRCPVRDMMQEGRAKPTYHNILVISDAGLRVGRFARRHSTPHSSYTIHGLWREGDGSKFLGRCLCGCVLSLCKFLCLLHGDGQGRATTFQELGLSVPNVLEEGRRLCAEQGTGHVHVFRGSAPLVQDFDAHLQRERDYKEEGVSPRNQVLRPPCLW